MRHRIRQHLQRFLRSCLRLLNPPPDQAAENRWLQRRLEAETSRNQSLERVAHADAMERIAELVEARQMSGAGPWTASPATLEQTDSVLKWAAEAIASPGSGVTLRESNPVLSQGAYGDIELALQNVEWRREINLSWLEFSRWGIQQIILISRLHFIKNPLIQRGINVAAHYVFGRGVEVSSPDPDANDVLKEFFERNKRVLGQIGLTDLERRKYYDGNLFFAFFADTNATGQTSVRMIDATEIQDVITDPDDTDTPWYYRRKWSQRIFNPETGAVEVKTGDAWYPALGYEPADKPEFFADKIPVMWETPVLHRKCGGVAKWHFGCPLVYAALDWARASKRFLEACATVKASLAQIAMTLTTKGGQAAIEGAKQQLSTTVGPQSSLWDENPTAVNASIFASGPGTTLAAFKTSGAGGDPEEVRRFELMVWRVFGLPETFGGDVKTGNLATAQSLDRPTELNFLEKQEAWREDLCTIAQYVLKVSMGASGGKLFEAMEARKADRAKIGIFEARRISKAGETVHYAVENVDASKAPTKIEVMVTFPSIREGDIPQLVAAVKDSMTLGNTQGQVVGIDERAGIRKLYELNGIDNGDELVDEQYPETGPNKYDPNRTKQDALEAKQALLPPAAPGGGPGAAPKPAAPAVKESLRRLTEAARKLAKRRAA